MANFTHGSSTKVLTSIEWKKSFYQVPTYVNLANLEQFVTR